MRRNSVFIRRCPPVFASGLIGLLTLVAAGCARPSAQRLNEDGNHAFNRGEFPQALEDYRKAQVERPDLPSLNYNAGNVLHQQGEFPRAIAESLRATRANDTDVRVRAFYSIGADYYREGKLREALDAYKNALRNDPGDLDAKYNIEVIQGRLDKEAAARAQLQQQNPDNQQNGENGQQGSPTPSPTPQGTSSPQQGQPRGNGGQPGAGQTPQQGQGQGQPGQQGQNPSQNPSGQQPGQNGQPGQPGQAGQPNQAGQPGQPGSPTGQPGSPPGAASGVAGNPGATGTPQPSTRAIQAQLSRDLRAALDAYDKAPSIEAALRILDILAEQERIAQAEAGSRSDPRTTDK